MSDRDAPSPCPSLHPQAGTQPGEGAFSGTKRSRFQSFLRARRAEIAVVFLLVLFVALTLVAKSPALRVWDGGISREIQSRQSPELTTVCEVFTTIGSWMGLIVVAIPGFVWLWRTRRDTGAWLFLLTVLGHVINIGLKAMVNRNRPGVADHVTVLLPAGGSSFPSGHAQAATMFFGFFAVLIAAHVGVPHWRRLWIGLSIFMALAICFSRLYLGAHFVSDIVGGIAAGLFFLLLWAKAYRHFAPEEFAPAREAATA